MSFMLDKGEQIVVPITGLIIIYPGETFHMIATDDPEAFEQLLHYNNSCLRNITISGGEKPEGKILEFLETVNSTLLPMRFLQGSELSLNKLEK